MEPRPASGSDCAIELPGRAPVLAALARAVSHAGWLALVGEPGSGKSTLLALATAGTDALVLRGVAALSGEPYVPFQVAVPELSADAEPAIVGAQLAALAGDRPVVVDDVQWCDVDSIAALTEFAWRRPLVVVSRSDPGAAEDLLRFVAEAGARVEVAPLVPQDARSLVRAWRPNAPAGDVERAVDAASGNPLALLVATSGGAAGATAIEAARRAVAALPEAPLRALATAALAGRPVRVDDGDAEELIRRGFATARNGSITPRHDLFAQGATEALDPRAIAEIHLDLAGGSETAIEAAHHLAAADRPAEAAVMAQRAATEAVTVWSRAEALSIAATSGDIGAARDAARALCLAGRYRESIDLLRGLEDADRTAQDALVAARAHWAITEIDEARSAVADGLARDPDPATAAELWSLRARIVTRVDWDLDGGMSAARRAVDLAERSGDPAARVAAHSALGLAALMGGSDEWADALGQAGALAARSEDVHNAVTVHDTLIFGHLLSGDPRQCGPLAEEMIELTETASEPWNGYFRAVALLVALHVDGAHGSVLVEAEALRRRRLSVKALEIVRTVTALAMTDSGRELEAVGFAREAVLRASDDTARANAMWVLAEAQLIAGLHEHAFETARSCRSLPASGFPGAVNAALAGAWAAAELDLDQPEDLVAALRSGFRNLRAAPIEAQALATDDAGQAASLFGAAADAWRGVSRRAELRCIWAAAQRAVEAGDLVAARQGLDMIDGDAPRWLLRRVDATRRAAGISHAAHAARRDVLVRVAQGLTSRQIARALAISTTTVETHVRRAMELTGAATRMQAAVAFFEADRTAGPAVLLRGADDVRCICGAPSMELAELAVGDMPVAPWSLARFVVRGRVDDRVGLAQLTLARLRGAAIDVVLASTSELYHELVDALDRTGGVQVIDGVRHPVEAEEAQMLSLLAAGSTVREVAAIVGWSPRTVQRRLAAVRHRFGVTTNREAVLAAGLPHA